MQHLLLCSLFSHYSDVQRLFSLCHSSASTNSTTSHIVFVRIVGSIFRKGIVKKDTLKKTASHCFQILAHFKNFDSFFEIWTFGQHLNVIFTGVCLGPAGTGPTIIRIQPRQQSQRTSGQTVTVPLGASSDPHRNRSKHSLTTVRRTRHDTQRHNPARTARRQTSHGNISGAFCRVHHLSQSSKCLIDTRRG